MVARTGTSRRKLIAALVVLAGIAVLAQRLGAQELLRDALAWIKTQGVVGVLAFVALYVLACVLFIPGSILSLGAGAVYGVVHGSLIVSLASTCGAAAAFLVGRYFARDWVAQKVQGNEKFAAIDEAVGREGWKIVGLTRLSPIFPFNLLNYAYGLTNIRFRDYFLASWVGMMPGTVMYVYLGSLAGNLASLGTREGGRTPAEWGLYVVGLLATVAVSLYVTRLAKGALEKKV